MDTLGNLLEQGSGNLLVGGEFLEVDGNEKLLSLLVDVTNVDTALVGEEDPITLSADVSGPIGIRLARLATWRSGPPVQLARAATPRTETGKKKAGTAT